MVDGGNNLENLALIGNGAKGAVDQTLSTRNTLLVINIGSTMLIRANGVHATSLGAGAKVMQYGMVGANLFAHTTLDALLLIDKSFLVDKADGAFWTDFSARVRKTTLAGV